jgi:hypothetical protein
VATKVQLRRLRAIQKGSRRRISRLAMSSRKPMLQKKGKKKRKKEKKDLGVLGGGLRDWGMEKVLIKGVWLEGVI